jgi:hypothetical protein
MYKLIFIDTQNQPAYTLEVDSSITKLSTEEDYVATRKFIETTVNEIQTSNNIVINEVQLFDTFTNHVKTVYKWY